MCVCVCTRARVFTAVVFWLRVREKFKVGDGKRDSAEAAAWNQSGVLLWNRYRRQTERLEQKEKEVKTPEPTNNLSTNHNTFWLIIVTRREGRPAVVYACDLKHHCVVFVP